MLESLTKTNFTFTNGFQRFCQKLRKFLVKFSWKNKSLFTDIFNRISQKLNFDI